MRLGQKRTLFINENKQYNILGLVVAFSGWRVKKLFRDRDGLRKVGLLAIHPPDVAASLRIFH